MSSYLERTKAAEANFEGVIHASCDDVIDDLIASGQKFDLILTDPPYNVGKDFGNNTDSLPLDNFLAEMKNRVFKLKQLLTDEGSIIWFGIHDYICYIQVFMYEAGLSYRRLKARKPEHTVQRFPAR